MAYRVKLSDTGRLIDCPDWWRNYINHLRIKHTPNYQTVPEVLREELAKYHARKKLEDSHVTFETEEDFLRFKLEWWCRARRSSN